LPLADGVSSAGFSEEWNTQPTNVFVADRLNAEHNNFIIFCRILIKKNMISSRHENSYKRIFNTTADCSALFFISYV